MRRLATTLLLVLLAGLARAETCPAEGPDFPRFYTDASQFERAFAKAEEIVPSPRPLTGLVVPHHLLADHLVARGFAYASAGKYRRIVVLFPDHFRQADKAFAVTARGFDTVFGRVATDKDAAGSLLAATDLVAPSCLFAKDHGLQAMLPFIAHHFPGVPIVPVAVSIKSDRRDWDRMADRVAAIAGPGTLVLESTDFSHYLPQVEARRRDQQTLNILAARDFDALARLVQPDHVDSLGALYIQAKLQDALYGAGPVALANENAQQYTTKQAAETTSYLVLAFAPGMAAAPAPDFPGATVRYFAGDTFFGRAMMQALGDPDAAALVREAVRATTAGRPIVANLEGVILPNVPSGIDHLTLAMPDRLALPWLKDMNVVAVSMANNHVTDLGPVAIDETRAALARAGIAHAGQGERLDLPGMTVIALTDLDSNAAVQVDLLTPDLLDRLLIDDATKPVVAFVHWGREWIDAPSAREQELATGMRRRGVALIVGAHPHVAAKSPVALAGGDTLVVHTLGNFLFDQTGEKASGALLEVTSFAQGTLYARLLPIPDLYDIARAAATR